MNAPAPSKPAHPDDEALRDLWSRRTMLSQAEWEKLYKIIFNALRRHASPELFALPESRDDYIQHFFTDKVFPLDHSDCAHIGALRCYFQRYLIDQIRRQKTRAEIPLDDTAPMSSHHDDEAANDEAAHDAVLSPAFDGAPDYPGIAASARAWLAASEAWARLYLALSYCPDAERSEPLRDLAARYNIASYAYKASRLGFNWKKGIDDYKNTLIGAWLVSLGFSISPDEMDAIHDALKILCFEALTWAEEYAS